MIFFSDQRASERRPRDAAVPDEPKAPMRRPDRCAHKYLGGAGASGRQERRVTAGGGLAAAASSAVGQANRAARVARAGQARIADGWGRTRPDV